MEGGGALLNRSNSKKLGSRDSHRSSRHDIYWTPNCRGWGYVSTSDTVLSSMVSKLNFVDL
jgi:hypothetical protein